MDWQQATALGIVAVTAGIFVWARFRPRPKFGKAQGPCGCSSHSVSKQDRPPTITFHAKRGERSQIIVKSS